MKYLAISRTNSSIYRNTKLQQQYLPKTYGNIQFQKFPRDWSLLTWSLNSIVINFDSNFVSSYRWNWNYTLMFAINTRFKLKTRRIVIGFHHISWNYHWFKFSHSLMFDFIVFNETLSSSFNIMLWENIYVIVNSRYIYLWRLWM